MDLNFMYINTILLIWVKFVASVSLSNDKMYFMNAVEGNIADYIASKGYFPNEKELPTAHLIKNTDNDANYLLSKLSDEELLKLLNEQPERNEYNLNDIVKIALDIRGSKDNRLQPREEQTKSRNHFNNLGDSFTRNKIFPTVTNNEETSPAFFKLNNKPVDSYKGQNDASYNALQKLKNLLNINPLSKIENNYADDDDAKKELLFDILVAQLKMLCCKRSKHNSIKKQYKSPSSELLPSLFKQKINIPNRLDPVEIRSKEYMFLIINDEIKSNGSDELMAVDPDSLDGNSSVLLLGPVTTPLSDNQLKLVMNRISNELVKPEYISLLQQLSDGVLINNNKNVINNFIFGPETRRYIKPHRCNHQSKLAKVYGGLKWIICTGYLNLNKPSLYD